MLKIENQEHYDKVVEIDGMPYRADV